MFKDEERITKYYSYYYLFLLIISVINCLLHSYRRPVRESEADFGRGQCLAAPVPQVPWLREMFGVPARYWHSSDAKLKDWPVLTAKGPARVTKAKRYIKILRVSKSILLRVLLKLYKS